MPAALRGVDSCRKQVVNSMSYGVCQPPLFARPNRRGLCWELLHDRDDEQDTTGRGPPIGLTYRFLSLGASPIWLVVVQLSVLHSRCAGIDSLSVGGDAPSKSGCCHR